MAYKCEHCGREFNHENSMKQHMLDKHGAGREKKKEGKKSSSDYRMEAAKKARQRKTMKRAGMIAVVVVITVAAGFALSSYEPPRNRAAVGPVGSTHIHQDYKVYINNEPIDFSSSRYQLRAQRFHFEGGDGDVGHVHATGVTLGYAFDTLGIRMNATCITAGTRYCNNGTHTLRVFVNSEENFEFGGYEPRDADRILITYGDGSHIEEQLASLTDRSTVLSTGNIGPNPIASHGGR